MTTSAPLASAMARAVWSARPRSLEYTLSNPSRRNAEASARACARPCAESGMSLRPWKRRAAFHAVGPCRIRVSRTEEISAQRPIGAADWARGEVAERLNVLAWKASRGDEPLEGSNPSLSAITLIQLFAGYAIEMR